MHADINQVRADDDPSRAGVVGEAGDFVRREKIEGGTGAGGSSRGVGQARERASGHQEGAKDAKGLPPRNPACPETPLLSIRRIRVTMRLIGRLPTGHHPAKGLRPHRRPRVAARPSTYSSNSFPVPTHASKPPAMELTFE